MVTAVTHLTAAVSWVGYGCYSPNGGGEPGVRRSRRRTGKRRCFLPDPGAEFSGRTAAAAGDVSGPDISARKHSSWKIFFSLSLPILLDVI